MADIATKTEVIAIAFTRAIPEARIPDGFIHAIEVKYILPILGEDFYDALVLTPGSYTALIALLKPVVAHYVRFELLPSIFVEISNTGLNKVPGNNRSAGTTEDLGSMRQSTLDIAGMYVTSTTKYLDDNYTAYPLYYRGTNPENRVEIMGGIIMQKEETDDDYFLNNTD